MPENQRSIFFSYGHDYCSCLVHRIKKDLESLEDKAITVWIDDEQIHEGDDWRGRITEGILNSDLVLGFLTEHALREGGVCLSELAIAVGVHASKIRTICLEPELDSLIPLTVSGIQYLDLSDYKKVTNLDGDEFEAWYENKFQLIIELLETSSEEATDVQLKLLEQTLAPNVFSSRQNIELMKAYTQRNWVNELVEKWLSSKDTGEFFLLMGAPGSGKSAFTAHYSHFNPSVVAAIFCEWGCNNYSDSKQIIRSIAFQLASKLPSYRIRLSYVLESTDLDIDRCSLRELFDLLFLHTTYGDIASEMRFMIIVDGIDEANANGVNELAETLVSFAPRLPKMLRFLITCGHDSVIRQYFEGYEITEIDSNTRINNQDLEEMLAVSLGEQLARYPKWKQTQLLRQMTSRCAGSFLYAELLAKTIRANNIPIEASDSLPAGLSGLYFDWMHRVFPTEEFFDEYYEALCIIACTKRPIPTAVLKKALGINQRKLNKLIRILGTFAVQATDELLEKTIFLFHQSFSNWLCSDSSGIYALDLEEGKEILANAFLKSYREKNMSAFELENVLPVLMSVGMAEERQELLHDPGFLTELVKLGERYEDVPNGSDRAIDIYRLVLSLLKEASGEESDEQLEMSISCAVARCQFSMGLYNAAIRTLETNIEKILVLCKPEDAMQALACIGSLYDWHGKREESVKAFSQLIKIANKENNSHFALQGNLGLIWNDHFNSIEGTLESLEEFSCFEMTPEEHVSFQLCLARVLLSAGRLNDAIDLYEECLFKFDFNDCQNTFAFHKNRMLLMEVLVAYFDNKRFFEGITCGQIILNNVQNQGWLEESYCSNWIARSYLQLGNLEAARALLSRCIACNNSMSEIARSDWMSMNIASLKADIAFESGDFQTADSCYEDALLIARSCSDVWVVGDVCFMRCLIRMLDSAPPSEQIKFAQLHEELKDAAIQSGLMHLKGKLAMLDAFVFASNGEIDSALDSCRTAREITNNYKVASMDILQMLYVENLVYKLCQRHTDAIARISDAVNALCNQIGEYSSVEQVCNRIIPRLLWGELRCHQ